MPKKSANPKTEPKTVSSVTMVNKDVKLYAKEKVDKDIKKLTKEIQLTKDMKEKKILLGNLQNQIKNITCSHDLQSYVNNCIGDEMKLIEKKEKQSEEQEKTIKLLNIINNQLCN